MNTTSYTTSYTTGMNTTAKVPGRVLGQEDIVFIRNLIDNNPQLHRTAISKRLCHLWQWYDHQHNPRDMACRSMLLRLERKGLICLPKRVQLINANQRRYKKITIAPIPDVPIECPLAKLTPLQLTIADNREKRRLFKSLLHHEHYLGYTDVGRNIKYLVFDRCQRPLACLLFGSAAWALEPRDRFIGWDKEQRKANIQKVTNNLRFLIRPSVKVPNLASYLLGYITRRIQCDWIAKYGHRVDLLETFVDIGQFTGAAYKAANWIYLGKTTGRTRNDRDGTISVPVKDIYVYALHSRWRQQLKSTP